MLNQLIKFYYNYSHQIVILITCDSIFAIYSSLDSPHQGEHFGSCFIQIEHLYARLLNKYMLNQLIKFYYNYSHQIVILITCDPIFAIYSLLVSSHQEEHFGSCFIQIKHLYIKLLNKTLVLLKYKDKIYVYYYQYFILNQICITRSKYIFNINFLIYNYI